MLLSPLGQGDIVSRLEHAPLFAQIRYNGAADTLWRLTGVELFDLSSTGFRMVTFARPQIGKTIWVSLPGLQPLEAVVRRGDGNNFGCEFARPLHPGVAASWPDLRATLAGLDDELAVALE